MNDKPSVIRETDEDARIQARDLMHKAAHAALAVIDPETGFPSVSRVLIAMDADGAPVILVSGLSSHSKALMKDSRASALFGEPGKGDPLAHPRLTLRCSAERIDRQSQAHDRIRALFLDRHPKSNLYIDFPDFCFFRLVPLDASLNGGFGRAYILSSKDLMML
ncbi:pyridoxamine 5'-phosphate oxidase family protein [Rhizobium sp. CNPSo 4039]|uniref:HugZ family pyridoxamine 5'-phosphate oxidase n=1 Tax=unclassified Rhizobium TaxID=2613769 RepID=UPI000BA8A650|nr:MULTISPECIES: pyridoxamine 5'-phosphate oxidase family protein [unclassified Rhizobium]ASW07238.1 heme iron utilization protein [Rhizobium sp. 11515TR]MDK4711668.1 pyridoxamine 5'-phosphate oxidase family protein [Rhizobium sp. CNPSo 4039]